MNKEYCYSINKVVIENIWFLTVTVTVVLKRAFILV